MTTLRKTLSGLCMIVFAVALVGVLTTCPGVAQAEIIEDFDGPTGVPYTLTNHGGGPPTITAGGGTNNFARITNLDGSNINTLAFDEDPSTSGPAPGGIQLAFDFRMSDDAANTAAGGCCGSAADGLGIGLFATDLYGTTGAGPTTKEWERPAYDAAFAVGLDIFQNIDVVSLNWNGAEIAAADVQPIMDLNNGVFHRALINIKPDGSDALVDMVILEDVDGFTMIHSIFSDQPVVGMQLDALPSYRLIAGGRTGGAFAASDIDNIALTAVPEPSTIVLLSLGLIGLAFAVRKRK